MNFICVYQVWSKLIEKCPSKIQDGRHESFFFHFNIRPRWFSAHHRDRLVFLFSYFFSFIRFILLSTGRFTYLVVNSTVYCLMDFELYLLLFKLCFSAGCWLSRYCSKCIINNKQWTTVYNCVIQICRQTVK